MNTIPVLYTDKQVAPAQGFSPSAAKPAQVVAEWQRLDLPIEVRGFEPASFEALCRAHDPDYVRGVLSCKIANGFGTRDAKTALSLPYTSGSMLAAAREALANGKVACSPTSGFHHAGYEMGGGFCTFNGLMVTALTLIEEGQAGKVGILDCDQHYGDGTDEILQSLDGAPKRIAHHTIGRYNYRATPDDVERCIRALENRLRAWKKAGVDVVLYQAGADAYVKDGGIFDLQELAVRDARVFSLAESLSLPVAWNLAGGYQRDEKGGIQPVLDIHSNTMRECVRAYGVA